MCACEPFFVCRRCKGLWPWDPDRALEQDDRERENERRERDISQPDFLKPFRDAA